MRHLIKKHVKKHAGVIGGATGVLLWALIMAVASIADAKPAHALCPNPVVGALGGYVGSELGGSAGAAIGAVLGCGHGAPAYRTGHYGYGHTHADHYINTFGGSVVTAAGPRRIAYSYGTPHVGWTTSRSIYYDQRPEVFGIYSRHVVVHRVAPAPVVHHVVAAPTVVARPRGRVAQASAAPEGCALYDGKPYIREHRFTTEVGGQDVEAYGQACMQPDGQWMVIGSTNVER